MGGKSGGFGGSPGGPRMGGSGKAAGGGGPMTAEQADFANQTRRQNLLTTVGGGLGYLPSTGLTRTGSVIPRAARAAPPGTGKPPLPPVRPTPAGTRTPVPRTPVGASDYPYKYGGDRPPIGAYGRSTAIDPTTGLPSRGGPTPAGTPPVAGPDTRDIPAPTVGPLAGLFGNPVLAGAGRRLVWDPVTRQMVDPAVIGMARV